MKCANADIRNQHIMNDSAGNGLVRIMTGTPLTGKLLGVVVLNIATILGLQGCKTPQGVAPNVVTNYIVQNSSWDYIYGYADGMAAERRDNLRFFCGTMKQNNMTVQDLINATTDYINEKSEPEVIEAP